MQLCGIVIAVKNVIIMDHSLWNTSQLNAAAIMFSHFRSCDQYETLKRSSMLKTNSLQKSNPTFTERNEENGEK